MYTYRFIPWLWISRTLQYTHKLVYNKELVVPSSASKLRPPRLEENYTYVCFSVACILVRMSKFELSRRRHADRTQPQSQLIIWMVAACWAWTEYASSVLCEPRSSYSSVQTWLQFNMVCRGGKRPTSARTTSNDQAARNDRTTNFFLLQQKHFMSGSSIPWFK